MLFKREDRDSVVFGADKTEPKTVQIKKITIGQWQRLFDVIGALPQLIINVLTAPPKDRTAYAVVAIQESFQDIISTVSVLTGIEEEWLIDNVSLDELLEYFVKTAKKNNFDVIIKNVRSVLNLSRVQNAE